MQLLLNKVRQCIKGINSEELPISIMQPSQGWQFINFKELKEYRDLFLFLVWRDIKAFYAQTILGFSWAILQPLIQIILFTIIFGKVAQLDTGGIPYFLFSTVAIIPWTYMSQAMSTSSQSLIAGKSMLGKIYFPRLIFPITPVLTKLVDFSISLLVILGVMLYYRVLPTWNILFLPLFMIYMISIPAGIGMWLSSLAIRFRDVKHAMPFLMRMMIYTAPIVYSANSIPDSYRFLYSLNPIVGVIEGYRACLLGQPIPWPFIWPGMITAGLLLISGALYFKRMEWLFVDVI
jgi:lipopolysaccharide transport system permease protein